MFLRPFLSRGLSGLIPLAIAVTVYLYLYPIFHGCAFPLPTPNNAGILPSGFLSTIRQHLSPQAEFDSANRPAIFRLLVLADPQLEGDSSLPKPEDKLLARIKAYRSSVQSAIEDAPAPSPLHGDVVRAVFAALRSLALDDVPRSLRAARKRLDLLGNDYYLAHIYRTLHWWTRPTHVTVLGDLIGSQWVTDEEFDRRGHRYWERVFKGGERVSDALTGVDTTNTGDGNAVDPAETLLNATDSTWTQRIINIAGNHDIGYSGDASESRIERFERVFGPANWDIRFRHPVQQTKEEESQSPDAPLTPTLHLINLNTLTLDTPAFSTDVQSRSYEYINDLITHRTYPVDDRATFTLLLTHLPLHKRKGICTDEPHFTFHESEDENGPDDVPRFYEGGLREQNHLSEHVSANGVLQGIFGMTGDEDASGGGLGRNGLILTGHDHTGCDVVHYVDRTVEEKEPSTDADETSTDDDNNDNDNNETPAWKWNARRYHRYSSSDARSDSPSIREVTLRSMMGEYGGNAGLLSLWFDADPAVGEWKYEITMCMAGVQHVWWAVHVLDLVVVILVVVYLAMGAVGSRKPQIQTQVQKQKPASADEKKQVQEKVQEKTKS
ncbi:uncharacterized protein KD926_000017 [Aspergillus affinis]|uniref:uncharacterized protein n=1 Tax=Aspergillus affinis TaxID=1070780 RepID=UPI0022FDC116|nr:uncharacterized protein KD926_000017 [Aspergillus affinis]KAI9037754.1 hypothetical protein KD926_000017 [Aspergillus affinis]